MKLTQEHYISNFSTRYVAEYGSIRYTALGRSRGGLTTKIHTVVASDRSALNFSLSSGAANGSPQGMRLLSFMSPGKQKQYLLMDIYKRRNEVERFFRRVKRFRRILIDSLV